MTVTKLREALLDYNCICRKIIGFVFWASNPEHYPDDHREVTDPMYERVYIMYLGRTSFFLISLVKSSSRKKKSAKLFWPWLIPREFSLRGKMEYNAWGNQERDVTLLRKRWPICILGSTTYENYGKSPRHPLLMKFSTLYFWCSDGK